MAKTRGPLFSLTASGQIGKKLTYIQRQGIQTTKKYDKPTGIPSPKQRARRRIMEFLVAQWQTMPEAEKNEWRNNEEGKRLNITGYQYFLKAAQADLYNKTGLICYYPMNEIINNQTHDFSGNGLHGDLEPTPPADAPYLIKSYSKKMDMGLKFDGNNDYVNIGKPPKLNLTNEMTFETFFFAEQTNRWEALFGQEIMFSKFNVHLYTSNPIYMQFHFNEAGIARYRNLYVLKPKQWYHLVGTYKNYVCKLYANGEEQQGSTSSVAQIRLEKDTYIGKGIYNLVWRYFSGIMDEVCIYNRAMSANEIWRRWKFASKNIKK